MTVAAFRKLALSFEGAEESSHMGHPDFRAGGRIFASLGYPSPAHGCVMLTQAQQEACMASAPDVFLPAAGAWGRAGGTVVVLIHADAESVGAAMTDAWQAALAKGPPKSAKKAVKKAVNKAAVKRAAKKSSRSSL